MKSKKILVMLALFAVANLVQGTVAVAQEKVKYADYLVELQEWQARENTAKDQIAVLEGEIAALRAQLNSLQGDIDNQNAQIFRAMDSSESAFNQYLRQLEALKSQIRGLNNLSPGSLVERGDEMAEVAAKLDDLKGRGEAKHPKSKVLISDIERMLESLLAKYEDAKKSFAKFDTYTVKRGDYLWKIAKSSDGYNDPFKWMKIYTKNTDVIKNPDMIYPDQNLKIFRNITSNEYEVVKGDFLYKIAGKASVYGDPFKWTKLYDLNKHIIQDQNVIYPSMVLIKQ